MRAWAVLIILLPSGCTSIGQYFHNGMKVGPQYATPMATLADDWIDYEDSRISPAPARTDAWWQVFEDPTLEFLIAQSAQQNLSLREVGFRVSEAKSQRRVIAGAWFPQTQEISGNFTRNQFSKETVNYSRFPPAARLTNASNWQVGANLAWEVDFWGKYRRAIEAADARLDASVAEYDDALVLLVAEVAATYVELRTVSQRIEVARHNAAMQAESARIAVERREQEMKGSEIDAPQAKSNLARTMSVIEVLEIQRRQAENRLCVLMGIPPQKLEGLLEPSTHIPAAPESIAVGVPAALLFRRPDVRRAERLAAAQSAEIGVAESNLYPHFAVNGGVQLEAARFANLFNGTAFAGVIGPSFRWDVLNYGRLQNQVDVEEARYCAQVTHYRNTLLQANEEAENAIIAFRQFHAQIKWLEESVRESQEAVRIMQQKYAVGHVDFNRLLTVEQFLTQQQDQLAIARGDLAQSLIELYRALGGGWEIKRTMCGCPQPDFCELPLAQQQELERR